MKRIIYKTSPDATKMEAMRFLAERLNIAPQNHRLNGFATACFDDNSISELVEALKMRAADKTDCQNWQISPTQWREAIREALEYRLWLAIEDVESA